MRRRLLLPSDENSSHSTSTFCDERLQYLDIRYWTTVPIPNMYAASVISLYMTTDHPTVALFDAELFIRDLVGRGHRFCSSLLVNAVLCYQIVGLQFKSSLYVQSSMK